MPSHRVKLEGREPIAEGTLALRFEKPAGFAFRAGQAVVLELLDPPAADGQKRRTFSLVSAPFESTLVIATRVRDTAFKRALHALPDGASVKLTGPIGQFGLADAGRPAVFIAGGIGITPFMSMLRQAGRERSTQSLLLLYSNRRPEDAAFLAELQELVRNNTSFRLFATMTDMASSARKWDGERGSLNADLIRRCAGGLAAPVYYVVGPPAMVLAMQETLRGAGVAADDIRSEEFYGY
ncbi:MAG TPA: FAD-dependent oxidoreductase [Burkholderiales bacterium]|nr:FAD-dependent oxidoreductase [Burkholderiales bacterium]